MYKRQTETDIDVEIEDSLNTDNSIRNTDSFNITSSFNTQTLNDYSSTIGVRQYQTNVGDLDFGGLFGPANAAGVTGAMGGYAGKHGGSEVEIEVEIDNRSLNLDQSVNQAVSTGDGSGVSQVFGQTANVAFGDESVAAAGDVTYDYSQVNVEIGDISIGNTEIETRINDSFNDFSENYQLDVEVEIEDSFNQYTSTTDLDVQIEDSFTSEIDATYQNTFEWENSGNLFSPGSAATGGENFELEF